MVATSKRTVNRALARAAMLTRASTLARSAILAATLLAAGPTTAVRADSTWVDRYRAAQSSYRAGDFQEFRARLLRVAAEVGDLPGINYNLACAEARLHHSDEAIRRLRLYAASGLVRDAAADSDFVSLWADPAFRSVAAAIRANGDSVGDARPLHRLRDPHLLTEDLAYDPASRSFYVTSIHRGRIVEVTHSGEERAWSDPALKPGWGVFAARVDAPHRLLWTTVAATPTTAGYDSADAGRTALIAWDLEWRRPARRIEWPRGERPHLLGDLTVGSDGTVYVCDSRSGAVRRLRPGADSLETLVANGGFRSPQTPALAPDGKRLYVPEYGRGIALLDLRTRNWSWLSFAPGLALQGIDGLYAYRGDLIAVQNGVTPRRVVRIRLDRSGTRAVAIETIESGTRRLGEPNHGVVVGGDFYFLANSGWDRVGNDDTLPETDAEPAAIYSAPLGNFSRAPRPARR